MKQKLAPTKTGRGAVLLVASLSCLSALIVADSVEQVNSWDGLLVRGRRQTAEIGRNDGLIRGTSQTRSVATATVSQTGNPQVGATAIGTNGGAEGAQLGPASGLQRPVDGGPSPSSDPDVRTPRPPVNNRQPSRVNRKKPSRQRPLSPGGPDRDDGDYGRRRSRKEDCDYDEDDDDGNVRDDDDDDVDQDDYRQVFDGMVRNPMRQFTRMMGSALDRMQGAYDYYDADGIGLRVGSRAGRDGYSRAASSITTNGRTRGLVSETRNGRTRTRRIGGPNNGARGYDDEVDEDN